MRAIYILIVLLVCSQEASAAQIYFGASGGWAFGGRFSGLENSTCTTSRSFGFCSEEVINLEGSNVDGEDSNAWGLKVGYNLTSVPWIGFEINYFQRNQRVQRQPFTAAGPNTTSMFPALPSTAKFKWKWSP